MHLVSLSQAHDAASVSVLSQTLEREHEVKREVTLQVMRWFGEVDAENESWNVDVEKVVRQVGLGVLRQHKVGPVYIFFSEQVCIKCGRSLYRMTRCQRTSSWISGILP
jgi:hypothetical protein